MDRWYILNNKGTAAEIDIVGDIGFFGVTAESFINEVKESGASELKLNVSSLGGSVNEALQIHDFLRSFNGRVTARVTGLTASAATIISMGADKIHMSENALFLVHNARFGMTGGTKEDLEEDIKNLEKIDNIIVNIYMKKTGRSEKFIRDLMMEDRWMDSKEAKSKGFVDKIVDADSIMNRAEMGVILNNVEGRNLPDVTNYLKQFENNLTMAEKSKIELAIENLTNKLDEVFGGTKEAENTVTREEAEKLVNDSKTEVTNAYEWMINEKDDTIKTKDEEIKNLGEEVEKLKNEIEKLGATKVETAKAEDTDPTEEPKAEEPNAFDGYAAKLRK
jgi:ATP-dependent protease ClpP protease subunit